jgi:hypothetical protein
MGTARLPPRHDRYDREPRWAGNAPRSKGALARGRSPRGDRVRRGVERDAHRAFSAPFTGLDPWYAMMPAFPTADLPHLPLPRSR